MKGNRVKPRGNRRERGSAMVEIALISLLFLAILINSLNAGLSGVLIPIGLEKMRIDPAVTSTVFVTTMTDTFGFFFFLGLADLFRLG